MHFLEPPRPLALAESGLGNHAEAARILDELLAKHGHEDNALLVGLLHKARTEVALAMGDSEKTKVHLGETDVRFRSTKNPALIAQCERLAERVARAGGILGGVEGFAGGGAGALVAEVLASRTVGELSAIADPCDAALRLLLADANATTGFLYLYRGESMRLAAASTPADAPRELEVALEQLAAVGMAGQRSVASDIESMDGVSEEDDPEAGDTVFVASAPPPNPWGPYQLLLLRDAHSGKHVAGGVILEATEEQVRRIGPHLMSGIARLLDERGTQTSALTGLGGTLSGVRGTSSVEEERIREGESETGDRNRSRRSRRDVSGEVPLSLAAAGCKTRGACLPSPFATTS